MNEPARVTTPEGDVRQVTLMQVCAGGARLAANERLRPGDVVALEFKLSPAQYHNVNAVVIYALKESKHFHWICGLSFVDTNPVGDKRLAAFVAEEQQRRKFGFAMPRN
jgi:hypothetical protein